MKIHENKEDVKYKITSVAKQTKHEEIKTNHPEVIIMPRLQQSGKQTKDDLEKSIKPVELEIGTKKFKPLKNETIILKGYDINITDHYTTAIDIHLNNCSENLSNVPHLKRYLNYQELREDLENMKWEFHYSIKDVNESAKFLINIMKNKVETYTEV
ncbi:hypothetical protein HHI36_014783, partial [Cryptolaemus montrouzieri]